MDVVTQACCMPLGIFTADVSVNLTRVDLGLRLTKGGLWPWGLVGEGCDVCGVEGLFGPFFAGWVLLALSV